MNEERFKLLVGVVKILQNQKETRSVESVMEIVENYNNDLTAEQKAIVLNEMLHFAKGEDTRTQRIENAIKEERLRSFIGSDYF